MGFMDDAKKEYEQDLPRWQQRQAAMEQGKMEGKARRQGAMQSAGSGIGRMFAMGSGGMTGMMFAANMFDGMADNVLLHGADESDVQIETPAPQVQAEGDKKDLSGKRHMPPEPTAEEKLERAMAYIEERESLTEKENENAFGFGG